jgi:hypothetical protein
MKIGPLTSFMKFALPDQEPRTTIACDATRPPFKQGWLDTSVVLQKRFTYLSLQRS